jgi:hypothetical protein
MNTKATIGETKATEATATPAEVITSNSNGKSYADGNHTPVTATGKTAEELALETAHAELIATARMCSKLTAPKVVKRKNVDKDAEPVFVTLDRHLSKDVIMSLGSSAIDAMAGYFDAYEAFEKSAR